MSITTRTTSAQVAQMYQAANPISGATVQAQGENNRILSWETYPNSLNTYSRPLSTDEDAYSRRSINQARFFVVEEYFEDPKSTAGASQAPQGTFFTDRAFFPTDEAWLRSVAQVESAANTSSTSHPQGAVQMNQAKEKFEAIKIKDIKDGKVEEEEEDTPKATPRQLLPKVNNKEQEERTLKRVKAVMDLPSLRAGIIA